MNAICVAVALGAGPETLTWLAVLAVGGFVLTLLAFLLGLIWMHRQPARTNVLLLRRRLEPTERAGAPDPRYDPRIFRSKR
ncbi:hypothetical protein [Cupriavidus basilensis]|uniref:hypothetical protein n=1 Tax=Cupriavidus basilensis TaxID=68895 RepID=UPI00157B3DF9|nr:hypothetical protein [Cupriavidus basilensis]NUA26128.1 hypothetical protein [Cupriavidus basilensis]